VLASLVSVIAVNTKKHRITVTTSNIGTRLTVGTDDSNRTDLKRTIASMINFIR
jgi:hypothetical protein